MGHLSKLADPRMCQDPGQDVPYRSSPQISREQGKGNGFPALPKRERAGAATIGSRRGREVETREM